MRNIDLMKLIDAYAAVSTGAVPDADRYKIGLRIQEARAAVVAEVEKLEVENAALLAANRHCIDWFDQLKVDFDKAQAENAKLKKDAARYQWMRELPNADSLNVSYMGADLDGVIDAAMETTNGQGD